MNTGEKTDNDSTRDEKFQVAEYFSNKNDFWNSVYREDTAKDRFIHFHMRKRKKKVFEHLDSFASGQQITVLDVGCGTGVFLEEMIKKGYAAAGIDLSLAMILDADRKLSVYKGILSDVVCADVDRLPFPDNYFDAVTCVGVLEYLKNEVRTLIELKRVLKPHGIVIFTLPNKYKLKNLLDPYYYLIRLWQYIFVKLGLRKKKNPDLRRYSSNESFTNKRYSISKLRSIVKNSELTLKEISSIGYGPVTFWKKEILTLKMSLRISDFIETRAERKKNTIFNSVPNRWVIYTVKE